MSEEPKSIWKKSWKGPRGAFLWFAILLPVVFIIIFLIGFLSSIDHPLPRLLFFAFLYAIGWALGVTFLMVFIRWVWCWKNFRRFLFGVACLITLIALAYAEEDWRGWHDWNKYKHEQEAKGEKFDLKDFDPLPVPDDQNFALTPIAFTSYGEMLTRDGKMIPEDKRDKNFVTRMRMQTVDYGINDPEQPVIGGNWATATMNDLNRWQKYYRALAARTNEFPVSPQPQSPAQDVSLALSKYDSVIRELRDAVQMPYSRFPLEYDKEDPAAILLPHLAAMKQCSQVLALRATAELQTGETDKAFDDVKLAFQLMGTVKTEPFIITHLVRIAMLQIVLQPVYEGLAEHKWSDAQLIQFDSELAKLNFLTDYERSLRSESAFHIKMIDYVEQKRSRINEFSMFGDENNDPRNQMNFFFFVAAYLGPKGWFYQNKITDAEMNEHWNLPVVDDAQQTVSPQKAIAADKIFKSLPFSINNFVARPLLPPFGDYGRRAAYGQTMANLACTAIALERYRLANGDYPNSLDSLSPQFMEKIPNDVIGGKPLNYRRTNDGQFILYSVGWNERDDGGVAVVDPKTGTVHQNEGDWVWRYPQK